MNNHHWQERWKPFFITLSFIAILWVTYLLFNGIKDLKENFTSINLYWLLFVLIFNIISGYFGFEAFRLIFNTIKPNIYEKKFLGNLYFTAQLIKHLPGRIFGIAYQVNRGGSATIGEWLVINSAYMAINTAFALWTAVTVAGIMIDFRIGLLAFLIGATSYFLFWHPVLFRQISIFLNFIFKSKARNIVNSIEILISSSLGFKLKIFFLFSISWILYLLAWAGYGAAWPSLKAVDGVWLCGIYTLAWFAGYVSFISPSGIGVRELVFVFLAKDFPPDAVAGMAILGRFVLLAVDIILGLIFLRFKENHG
jgi:glycosyltransferase 2 family protein